MLQLKKKSKRLNPVIEERQATFDSESDLLTTIRKKRIQVVAAMRAKQSEYMTGVTRLNDERGTANRLMLEALETGLDSVKNQWMKLYQGVIEIEAHEKAQLEIMAKAHRELEAIKSLQEKYHVEIVRETNRREQKILDEHSLGKFVRQS
jgi:flagellar biosynthesis chaperone FliJ